MEDQLYDQPLRFYTATQQKYPHWIYDLPPEKRVNAKSQFRQTAKTYRAGGILYHVEVLVKSQLPDILMACVDNPISGGHFGRDIMLAKISDRYYWKCFIINPKISKEAPPLNSVPAPGTVWSLVGVYMIGPVQETSNGN